MNKEELYDYIRTILGNTLGNLLVEGLIKELDSIISTRPNFSCNKFKEWLDYKNIAYKNTPQTFLRKCGFEDIKKGEFDDHPFSREKKVYAFADLFNAMRNSNIQIYEEDTYYISYLESYLLERCLISFDELVAWNHKALEHLSAKGKTTKDFIFLFKNTKVMRAIDIPFEKIGKEVEELDKKWNELMAIVESVPIVESETENGEINY